MRVMLQTDTTLVESPQRDALDPTPVDADRLELDLEPGEVGTGGEPGSRRARHAAPLLGIDHLQGMTEGGSTFLLDLDHDQAAPSAQDEVELVAAGAGVGVEQAVAAKPVVAEGAALAAIHAAS